ncbi:MAG: hypothetical protein AAB947_01860 [Patescibacteria group bacterium]
MNKKLSTATGTITALFAFFVTLVFILAFFASFSHTFADTVRGRGTSVRSGRYAGALTPTVPLSVSSQSSDTAGHSLNSSGSFSGQNNGGAVSGNGGNGGGASPGGSVTSGNTVSHASAINILNTTIVRIGR